MIINKIFSNVETFKDIFSSRIVGTYGRSVEESHRFEKYIVLGTMIRDYASVAWKKTKESVQKNGQREMVYFSFLFLFSHSFSKCFAFSSCFFECLIMNRIVKTAAKRKTNDEIAAGIYSDLSSGKYKNRPMTLLNILFIKGPPFFCNLETIIPFFSNIKIKLINRV